MRHLRLAVAVAIFVGLIGVGCVGPAKSYPKFESKAAASAESALSAVQTVRVGARLALANRAFGPYLAVLAADAEEDVSTAQGHFDSIQPPNAESDALRRRAGQLLSGAADAVEDYRIAMRRGDLHALAALESTLADLTRRLQAFLDQHG